MKPVWLAISQVIKSPRVPGYHHLPFLFPPPPPSSLFKSPPDESSWNSVLCDFSGLPNHTFWIKNSLRTPSGVTTSCYQWESEDSGIWSEDMMGGVFPAWDTRLLSACLRGAALALSQAWSVPEEPPTSLNQFAFVLDSPKLKTESPASHTLHESPGWHGWWLTATHIFTLLSSWISPCQPWWPASCVYIVPSKPFECLHHSTKPFPSISFHPNHLCICFSIQSCTVSTSSLPWLLSAVLCPSFPASLDLLLSIISTMTSSFWPLTHDAFGIRLQV